MSTRNEWTDAIRSQFPILTNNPDVVYLDNAATSQKPAAVLDRMEEYSVTINANVSRGSYPWANYTADDLRAAHDTVLGVLGGTGQLTWTAGASAGLHAVAHHMVGGVLRDGDEVVVPLADHGALATAWRTAAEHLARCGVGIRLVPMPYEPASGDYDFGALADLITPRTRVVNATATHHVYGASMNLHRLRPAIGDAPLVVIDAAQAVGHEPFNPAALGADYAVFSAHKAYGPFGVGAIWSAPGNHDRAELPGWAGTPNVTGIIGAAAGLQWAAEHGLERIHAHKQDVLVPLTDYLARSPSYRVLGCQESLLRESTVQRRNGVCSFVHTATSAADVSFVLADRGIYVRADAHCQAGGGARHAATPSVRVSVAPFTTGQDMDRCITVLKELE